ncbi:MAG TPA: class III extradiol ring-cleavage dioxygenase [Aquihabitans sp.]|jgi:aromatic ring-opening dioxygenase catalytic subunit (LigB family)|nr:class III extradiol ring-cleavage dioxygenase [Aquihabitans sp.]
MTTTTTPTMPTYFISHGGGPWPWLTGPIRDGMAELEQSLRKLPAELPTAPKAILMVSGHWEAPTFTVQTNPNPPMLYDYGGFPEHTYRIQYPAPGSPALAARVVDLLTEAGIPVAEDPDRGYDHGMFAPMAAAWPDAEIPVVQMSIKHGYDPDEHLAVGRALAPLRNEGILILGSGLSYHNLRLMGSASAVPSRQFDDWLGDTVLDSAPAERTARLQRWEQAPSARVSQPEEDHLIPLMVVVGASEGDTAVRTYHQHDFFGHATASSFRFDAAAPADQRQGSARA